MTATNTNLVSLNIMDRIGSTFGIIFLISGMIGILAGAEIARWAKARGYQTADAIVCAVASGCSAICVFLVPLLVTYDMTATWVRFYFDNLLVILFIYSTEINMTYSTFLFVILSV